MTNQSSQSLVKPEKWEEKFFIHLVGKIEPILIDQPEYNGILQALENGAKHVKIRQYLIMLNSIVVVEPRYGADNIPPRPKAIQDFDKRGYYNKNQKEIDLWHELYGMKGLEAHDQN